MGQANGYTLDTTYTHQIDRTDNGNPMCDSDWSFESQTEYQTAAEIRYDNKRWRDYLKYRVVRIDRTPVDEDATDCLVIDRHTDGHLKLQYVERRPDRPGRFEVVLVDKYGDPTTLSLSRYELETIHAKFGSMLTDRAPRTYRACVSLNGKGRLGDDAAVTLVDENWETVAEVAVPDRAPVGGRLVHARIAHAVRQLGYRVVKGSVRTAPDVDGRLWLEVYECPADAA